MAFVQFSKVSLAFGDRDILKDCGLNLASGSRAALAGANGSGKSTLMKVIAGSIEPDSGERALQKGTRVSWLPQSGIVYKGRSVYAELLSAFSDLEALLHRMESLGSQLQESASDDTAVAALVEEHHDLHTRLEDSGWYERDQRIAMVSQGLGFIEADMSRDCGEFSGGWQMRIALAKVLLEAPDILLLDEPTNYLDIEARDWLEQWLLAFKGGFLLVSHDRYFLDVCVNEVYELFQGDLKRYVGNYSHYEKVRQVELESLVARYKAQQEEIAKTEDFIRRFRYQATKASLVQDRVKRLEKLERIEIPDSLKRMRLRLPEPPHSGRIALNLRDLSKAYGERTVISGLDLLLESGEKLVVVGRNGAGKSTLLRILSGSDTSYGGQLEYGAGICVGSFSQDNAETLQGTQSILEYLEDEAPTELIPRLRDLAGAFLFHGDDVHKQISVLSGGEKSRLALLKLLLRPANLLILDEPTNHLDLVSKDVLLDALKSYKGTVIFVSHDRGFMQDLATKTLELSPAGARQFPGGYTYYQERLQREREGLYDTDSAAASVANAGQGAKNLSLEASLSASSVGSNSASSEFREAEKKRAAAVKRLRREEEQLLTEIDQLEQEKTTLFEMQSRPEVYSDGEKCKSIQNNLERAEQQLVQSTERWESIAEELERLEQAAPEALLRGNV